MNVRWLLSLRRLRSHSLIRILGRSTSTHVVSSDNDVNNIGNVTEASEPHDVSVFKDHSIITARLTFNEPLRLILSQLLPFVLHNSFELYLFRLESQKLNLRSALRALLEIFLVSLLNTLRDLQIDALHAIEVLTGAQFRKVVF